MRQLSLLFVAASFLMIAGCKEHNELINLQPNDAITVDSTWQQAPASLTPQLKISYVEEATGVKCKNCPTAHEALYGIMNDYPGRLSVAALHCDNSLCLPFKKSKYDFRAPAAFQLTSIIGVPSSMPIGSVNRQHINGVILQSFETWRKSVEEDLVKTSKANIIPLSQRYNAASGELSATYRVEVLENINEPLYFSVLLTESGMVDLQETNTEIDSFYVHNNVLRKTVDNFSGKKLDDKLTAGTTYRLKFTTTLNKDWQPANMKIVTLLNHNGDKNKLVIQSNTAIVKL